MVTTKLKHILIFVSTFILSACTQTADMYFYSDESWQVSSKIILSDSEKKVMGSFDKFFESMELPIETNGVVGGLTEGGLDMMTAQYANVGIDFSWSKFGSTYSLTAKGQTLEQFENLSPVPGMITLTKEAEDRYHLQADFTEAAVFAAAFYKLDITLHASEIYSSNAVRKRSGTAQWINPTKIDVVFAPSSPFPWGVLLTVCGVGLLGAIPFFALAGKKKCPGCGKRVSKKSEYCANCGEMIVGDYSGSRFL